MCGSQQGRAEASAAPELTPEAPHPTPAAGASAEDHHVHAGTGLQEESPP